MFVVEAPEDGRGNLSANSPTTLATSAPEETSSDCPSPWMPFALFQSLTYSSMANDTRGLLWICVAVVELGRAQKYSMAPSLTYMKVRACGVPSLDAVARVMVF